MTTSELISFLKKYEFGGATGRPREVSFDYHGLFIPTPTIDVDSTGDGLFTEICLGLDMHFPHTNYDKLRAMSIEEMAEFMSCRAACPPGKVMTDRCQNEAMAIGKEQPDQEICGVCWHEWLKQEAEE